MLKLQPIACLAAASIVLMASLSSCSYAKYEDPVRPPAESLADTEPFVNEMLAEDLGYASPIRVESAREGTCFDPVKNDDWNRVTEVRTYASGHYPDAASSEQAMDTMESYVKSQGWTLIRRNGSADYQSFLYEKGDLRFSADYEYAEPSAIDPYHAVGFDVRTGCLKHPKDHVLVRSKYDPQYGVSSQYYDFEAEQEDPADTTQTRLSTPYGEETRRPNYPDDKY